jgi:CBS domain-containing protein
MHDFTQRPAKARDVMTGPPVETVPETSPVGRAADMMRARRIRHLPVLRNNEVVGVLSERDVLRYLLLRGMKAGEQDPVSSAMSAPAAIVGPNDPLGWASGLMAERKLGCLPVVDEGRLRGIITLTDLIRHREQEDVPRRSVERLPLAKSVMKPRPVFVAPESMVLGAIALMASRGIRHLPVVSSAGQVVGIITDRDVRTLAGDPRRAVLDGKTAERMRKTPVSEVMSQPVATVTEETPLFMVAEVLARRRLGAVPVLDGNEGLAGIISTIDVIKALL